MEDIFWFTTIERYESEIWKTIFINSPRPFYNCSSIAISQFYDVPDSVEGILLGVGIGIILFPLVLTMKI